MPGPAPKPTKLKLLEGNPGKRTLPQNEPKVSGEMPDCPAFLKGAGRAEWKRMAPRLYVIGCLSQEDRAEFAGYCIAWGQLVEVEQELAKVRRSYKDALKLRKKNVNIRLPSNGMVSITSNGNSIIEPLLSVRKQALELIKIFGAEFGMSPASRTRIAGVGANERGKNRTAMQRLLEAQREVSN